MKRLSIYHFPGLNPTPSSSRYLFLAVLIGFWQRGLGVSELRIIDEKTGKHTVF